MKDNKVAPMYTAEEKKDMMPLSPQLLQWDTSKGRPPGPDQPNGGFTTRLGVSDGGSMGSATSSQASLRRESAWDRARKKSSVVSRNSQIHPEVEESNPRAVTSRGYLLTLKDVFSSKHFTDWKLEILYQRYFFKLNQTNLSILMALTAVVCVVYIVFHYWGGMVTPAKGIVLGSLVLILVAMELFCHRPVFYVRELDFVSCMMPFIFATILILVTLDADPRSASEGVWAAIFFIYMSYTLLPLRMRLCVASGVSLSVIHTVCAAIANLHDWFLWKQVSIRV